MALAQAEGGEHDVLRLAGADDLGEHHGAEGQKLAALLRHGLDARQQFDRAAADLTAELQRHLGRHGVVVHHPQRIVGLMHVQLGERAPGAADRIERPPGEPAENRRLVEDLGGDALGLADRALGRLLQADAAERIGQPLADRVAVDVDQLERAAAEVAGDAVGIVDAGDDAVGGETGLVGAGQDLDLDTADAFELGDEGRAVLGLTRGGGRQHVEADRAALVGDVLEAAHRIERLGERGFGETAGLGQPLAEAGENLFVEQHRGGARQPLVDDQAHRVGADVDDRERPVAFEATGGAATRQQPPPTLRSWAHG